MTINLIPASRIHARRRGLRLRRWSVGCVAYGLAVGAVCVIPKLHPNKDHQAALARLGRIDRDIQVAHRAVAERQIELRELQQDLAISELVGHHPDWSILLAFVSSKVADEIVLRRIDVRPVRAGSGEGDMLEHELTIEGYGLSQRDVSDFALRLEDRSLLDSVTFVSSQRVPFLSAQAISFEIECSLGGGAVVASGEEP